MSSVCRNAIVILLCGVFLGGPALATHSTKKDVEALSGTDLADGKPVAIKAGKHGTVVTFMSARCPCSNAHVAILKKLAEEFKDFSFVVINSNSDETLEEARTYFKAADFGFPVLRDEDGKLADQFKALKTPHAYLLGTDGATLYRGGMTASAHGDASSTQYLREALVDVDAHRPVKTAEGRTLGCMITRGKK